MKAKDLIELAKNYEMTPERIAALNERLRIAEEKFAADRKSKEITEEWLNRKYTI